MLNKYLKIIVLIVIIVLFCLILLLGLINLNNRSKVGFNLDINIGSKNGISLFNGFINLNKNGDNLKYSSEIQNDIDGIKSINLDFDSGDVELKNTSDSKIRIEQMSDKKITKEDKLSSTKNGDSLDFTTSKSHYDDFVNHNVLFKVYIPSKFKDKLDIKTESGDIDLKNIFDFNSLRLFTAAGDIESGSNIIADKLYLNSSAGSLDLSEINCKNYDININSGDIDIKDLNGTGRMISGSGDIDCKINRIDGNSSIEAKSGDIDLNIKEDSKLNINATSEYGEISNKFINHSVDGAKMLEVKSSSGDIDIE